MTKGKGKGKDKGKGVSDEAVRPKKEEAQDFQPTEEEIRLAELYVKKVLEVDDEQVPRVLISIRSETIKQLVLKGMGEMAKRTRKGMGEMAKRTRNQR